MTLIVSADSIGAGTRITMVPGDLVDVVGGVTVGSTDNSVAISSTTGNVQKLMSLKIGGQVYGYDAVFFSSTSTAATVTVLAGGSLNGDNGDGYACFGIDTVTNYGTIAGDFNGAEEHTTYFTNYGSVSGGSNNGLQIDTFGDILNAGSISGSGPVGRGIFLEDGSSASIVNTGSISGVDGAIRTAPTAFDLTVVNSGTISSTDFGDAIYVPGSTTASITNTAAGVINGGVAMVGTSTLVNSGAISGLVVATVVTNYGTIGGDVSFFNGVFNRLINWGTVNGDAYVGGASANAGLIAGKVSVSSAGGAIFDSTLGRVVGTIGIGSAGGTVIAGQSGGAVTGGTGNDILYANPTATAADHAVHTTLDGAGGTNALYGDGAFTTFMAGDANGGYNQIWGGASQMAGVAGFANNTLSFAGATHGVYVDLLNGHDAFVSSATNWAGAGTFEDSIVNVPNVVGSGHGDLIQADAGIDGITGGGGADSLYAGSGAGSHDTFVYTAYADSNTVTGYDTIVGFKLGTDKIDLSALHTNAAHLAISTAGTSNTLYVEATPGTFNKNTDLALVANTSATGGLHASDFVF
jgi:hypothetical protein